MRKEPHFVITYQHLFGLVILNLIILIALILFCKLSNKAERYRDFLLSVCWLVFSWYYQLQISDHLPTSIHRNHPSSYNQVVFVENPRFFTWYISVRKASVMDIS